MVNHIATSLLVLCVGGACLFEHAWAQSIAESARARPGEPVIRGILRDITPAPIEKLAVEADLVLLARVTRTRTYLTADEQYVLTEYRVSPKNVILGRVPSESATPGEPPSLTFAVVGGDLTVDGIQVRGIDYNLELPKSGSDYLLFLTRFGGKATEYQVHRGAIFEVTAEGFRHLFRQNPTVYSDVTRVPPDLLISRIRSARGK